MSEVCRTLGCDSLPLKGGGLASGGRCGAVTRTTPHPTRFARRHLPLQGEVCAVSDGPLRSHRPQRGVHAGQARDPFRRRDPQLCGFRRPHRGDGTRAEIRARRRPRRPRRDPQPQPSGLSGAALCLRAARRHAGAAELAARGGRAVVHPVRCFREGAGGRAGICGCDRAAAETRCPDARIVGLDFAPERRRSFDDLLARGQRRRPQSACRSLRAAADRLHLRHHRTARRARCCGRRRWSGTR